MRYKMAGPRRASSPRRRVAPSRSRATDGSEPYHSGEREADPMKTRSSACPSMIRARTALSYHGRRTNGIQLPFAGMLKKTDQWFTGQEWIRIVQSLAAESADRCTQTTVPRIPNAYLFDQPQ